jgi:hypothetical protein
MFNGIGEFFFRRKNREIASPKTYVVHFFLFLFGQKQREVKNSLRMVKVEAFIVSFFFADARKIQ